MKKSVLVISLLCAALMVSAQTYKNGVWYALYDESEHAMNTQGDYEAKNIFAPTTGALTVKWKYEWIDWWGAFRNIDTDILESSDSGNSTKTVGSLAENTDDNSNTTEHFTVSRNINWIKYNREGYPTHKVIVYHQSLPLAKHILLPSGTYGTTTASKTFADQDMWTVSEPQRVSLRSFLSAADITVTSSLPTIFRVGSADNVDGLTYAVGANACASANVGKIDDYAFNIYFTPQDSLDYEATITITDGTSTATVTVSGTGLYVAPPEPEDTYYAYSAMICEGEAYTDELFTDLFEAGEYTDTIPNVAGADSIITFTLTVNPVYAFSDSLAILKGDSAAWQDIDLSLMPVGDTTLVAAYSTIFGCDSTYTLYLSVGARPTTYGNDTIEFCSGDPAEYDGHTYRRATVDSVVLSIPNSLGGDSIVELVVIMHTSLNITFEETIEEGTEMNWEGYDLSQYPVGDTTLVAEYTSIYGCDSTYVLNLTVTAKPVDPVDPVDPEDPHEGINNALVQTKARKIILNGQIYIRKGEDLFDVLGNRVQRAM